MNQYTLPKGFSENSLNDVKRGDGVEITLCGLERSIAFFGKVDSIKNGKACTRLILLVYRLGNSEFKTENEPLAILRILKNGHGGRAIIGRKAVPLAILKILKNGRGGRAIIGRKAMPKCQP